MLVVHPHYLGFRISLSLLKRGTIFQDENYFFALTWRDEIEIIIRPFLYFKTRTRVHIAALMFQDEIETSENHFSWSSEKKWSWLSSRIPGIENSRWLLILCYSKYESDLIWLPSNSPSKLRCSKDHLVKKESWLSSRLAGGMIFCREIRADLNSQSRSFHPLIYVRTHPGDPSFPAAVLCWFTFSDGFCEWLESHETSWFWILTSKLF